MKHLVKSVILISILIWGSCKPSPQKAEKYYDAIIEPIEEVFKKEDVLISLINAEMDKTIKDSSSSIINNDTIIADTAYKKLDMAFSNLQIQVNVSINKLESLSDFDKSNTLKIKAINLMEEYNTLCKNEYAGLIYIIKIPEANYTLEDDDKFLALSESIDNKLQEKISGLLKEIKLFAKKYNFEIEKDTIN